MAIDVAQQPSAPQQELSTLPALFLRRARANPDAIALREKVYGIWREYSWADYEERARAFGLGMLALGLTAGEKIAILSEDRPEWVFGEIGAISVGLVSVGVYPTNPANEVAYILSHSEARLIVAEDQEQVDKVIEAWHECPNLLHVVVIDDRGVRAYGDPRIIRFDEVLANGRAAHAEDPDTFDRIVSERRPDEIAMIVYTSGTTGPPKGAMLSNANLASAVQITSTSWGELGPSDRVLSYLPLCHVAEKIFTIYVPLAFGVSANFAESIETVPENLREVEPTVFLGVPRIWEKMAAGVQIRMRDASRIKRAFYRAWMPVGMRAADARLRNKGKTPFPLNLLYGLGWLFVFRPLKKRLGMARCAIAVSGAAPISPDVLKFFHALGVPVREGWAQTESCGIGSLTPPDDIRLGTIGVPLDQVEVKISAEGEILVRGPFVFAGYYKDPEATARTVDAEGWLHTGDVGEFDEHGHLKIVDRMKDIIITAGGKNLSPSEIENRVKESPFIKECVAIGDRRPYVTALIGVEFDVVSDWATRKGIAVTTYKALTEESLVHELVGEQIKRANERMAGVEQIKKFRLLPKELDHEDGELTATQKVRRATLVDRFDDLIEEMYAS